MSVSSFGSLSYFTRKNAPAQSTDRCINCTVPCIYNAVDFYTNVEGWFDAISQGDSDVRRVLEKSPFGKCVYKTDNDVVDHQVCNMLFENGATAQLTMTAFSDRTHRNFKIHGTKGEISGNLEQNTVDVAIFGGESYTVDISKTHSDLFGHGGGGDKRLVGDFIGMIKNTDSKGLTDVKTSLESHLMAFAAEKSRLNGGQPVKIVI